ncbi:F0F1 ATP synthase subunit delta [Vaginisenegalia massiliensis]|uniref:F0F1 ATP synthase subunit delta n=1 Tax=Vaginisenegalia massiliensis TaxID=2058294 RepID=UPI000F526C3D|nr:F0F1 ATP synthase subunit delta [Vaginisenegalia massiliensis]
MMPEEMQNMQDAVTRPKQVEDELLQKIQTERLSKAVKKMSQHLQNSVNKEVVRDINRTNYENDLVAKLMEDITDRQKGHSSIIDEDKTESLMITSAVPLTDEQKERIVRKFMEKCQRPIRRITTVTDPSLLTGVRLQSDSFYYELTGQKTLRELHQFMSKSWMQGDEK